MKLLKSILNWGLCFDVVGKATACDAIWTWVCLLATAILIANGLGKMKEHFQSVLAPSSYTWETHLKLLAWVWANTGH